MPFKHKAARRHRIPKARYRVRNWPEYEAGLKRRGDLTLWLEQAALAGWQAPRRTTPGGQAWYPDAAIELVLVDRHGIPTPIGIASSRSTSQERGHEVDWIHTLAATIHRIELSGPTCPPSSVAEPTPCGRVS